MSLNLAEATIAAAIIGGAATFAATFIKERRKKPERVRKVRDDWQQWAKDSQTTILAVHAQQLADCWSENRRKDGIIQGLLGQLRKQGGTDEWRRLNPAPDGEGPGS